MITRNRMRLPILATQAVVCPKGEPARDAGAMSTLFTYDARDPFAVTLTLTTSGVEYALEGMERIVPEGSESGRIDWSRELGWLVSGGEAA